MALTDPKDMELLLREAYNPTYYEQVWRQLNYAFGDRWDKNAPSGFDKGDFPDWGSVNVRWLRVGESRDIVMNQFLSAAKVVAGDPEPEFPALHPAEAKLRAQAYLARYRGQGDGDGEWSKSVTSCYLEGDSVGRSFMQLQLRTNPRTGKQATQLRHSPTLLTLLDPSDPDPAMAQFVAFVKYVPQHKAIRIWGQEVWDKYKYRLRSDDERASARSVMRVIEWYDLGIGRSTPTMAIIPMNFGEKPLLRRDNAFGCLPMAWYEHIHLPGMEYPTGRVALQMAIQEALNRRERRLNAVSKRGAIDLVKKENLDAVDFKRWNNGDDCPIGVVGKLEPGSLPWHRISPEEIAQTEILMIERLERKMNTASGQTEFAKGNVNSENRTLGESQLLVQQSSPQMEWSDLQATRMHIRLCDRAINIMRRFDRDPLLVPYDGYQIPLNDPEDPNTWMDHMFAQPSHTIIGAESLRARDKSRENAERQALLMALRQYVPMMPLIDPKWYQEQLLRTIGENEPSSRLIQPPMQQPMMPGQQPAGGMPA